MAILEVTQRDAVTHLTMNSPERLNALSDEMLAALQETLDTLAEDPDCRVITLSGAGKAFCAGHDLRQMQAMRQSEDGGTAAFADLFARCTDVMMRIQTMPQPVIAQVHGIATAAGCQLVATCDLAVAAHGTRFGVNGVNIDSQERLPEIFTKFQNATKFRLGILRHGKPQTLTISVE